MVRLKAGIIYLKIRFDKICFNSIMVRLKVDKKITFTSIKKVSIPLWYD